MDILDEMREYYRKRAPEYDDWYFRRNAYDKGRTLNAAWFRELKVLRKYARSISGHKILEVAAGTGMWTQYLAEGNSVTPVDTSPEALCINRARSGVAGVVGDAFQLAFLAPHSHDLCFFAFWISHVPEEHMARFFRSVADAVSPTPRVVVVDSIYNPTELNCLSHENSVQMRALRSGRAFRVFKKYYTPSELRSLSERYLKHSRVTYTGDYFFVLDGVLRRDSEETRFNENGLRVKHRSR